jgi:hypothetical protein
VIEIDINWRGCMGWDGMGLVQLEWEIDKNEIPEWNE